MNIVGYYLLIILVYIGMGFYGLFINYFKIDIVYFCFIIFLAVGSISIIVNIIDSKQNNKKPFYKEVYKNNEFILISCLNYIRLFLFTTAISFKNWGIVTATYLTFPIYVAILTSSILNIKLKKEEIAGVIISIVGILIINYSSIKMFFVSTFTKMSLYEILYPLIAAVIFAYQLILSKKYNKLNANELIITQFIPVLPIALVFVCIRNIYPFNKIYEFLLVPTLPINFKHIIYAFIYSCIQFYLGYLIIFLFIEKYSPLLASVLSYISIFVSFMVQRYYFGKHICYYKLGATLFILIGIILISYTEHDIRKIK
jgi:drug/metabolite transporter (DMT)-like permease